MRTRAAEFGRDKPNKTLIIKLLPEEFDAFCKLSHQESRTAAQQARHLIRTWVKQQPTPPPGDHNGSEAQG